MQGDGESGRSQVSSTRQASLSSREGVGSSIPELFRRLDGDGVTIRGLAMSEPTLADVFLRHTGREIRSEAADAFDITVTDQVTERAGLATKTLDYIARRTEIDYATYVRFRGKLAMK